MPDALSPEAVRAELCARIAEGRSVRSICGDGTEKNPGDPDMPNRRRVFEWLAEDPEFAKVYALAMKSRADAHAEDILEIADDQDLDHNEKRVRIDARKWLSAKMRPEKYGDRLDLNHSGAIGSDLTPEQRRERIAALEAELLSEAQRKHHGSDGGESP